MDILKLFTRRGTPFAVRLEDAGVERNAFIESLTSVEVCDKLLQAGWELVKLPNDFRKDNKGLSELPTEEWNPTTTEEQDLWDHVGQPLTQAELGHRLTRRPDLFSVTSTGEYTIVTRKELTDYLDGVDSFGSLLPNDYLPLNYFVHPDALFETPEFFCAENSKYASVINKRRVFTYERFQNLVKWGFTKGLKPDFKAADFLEFYFQWGVDGIKPEIYSKNIKSVNIGLSAGIITMDSLEALKSKVREYGAINNMEELRLPAGAQSYDWEYRANHADIQKVISALPSRHIIPIELVRGEKTTIISYNCDDIEIDTDYVKVGRHKSRSIIVKSPVNSTEEVHPKWWNPSCYEEMMNDQFLYSLAYYMREKLTVETDACTYKALIESGCSPYSALYRMAVLGREVASSRRVDPLEVEELLDINNSVIMAYLEGGSLTDAEAEYLDSLVAGDVNFDSIYEGQQLDATSDIYKYYRYFYVARHVCGVSLEELYKKVHYMEKDTEKLVLVDNEDYMLCLDATKNDRKEQGYHADLHEYQMQQADECVEAIYVLDVARELSTTGKGRHVGVKCLVARRDTDINDWLEKEASYFCSKVEENVIGRRQQDTFKLSRNIWAWKAFFAMVQGQSCEMSSHVGGEVRSWPMTDTQRFGYCTRNYVEGTLNLADSCICSDGTWFRYCVNATITPEKVYPRINTILTERAFIALWPDFSSAPDTLQFLASKGQIDMRSYEPWTGIYGLYNICNSDITQPGLYTYYHESMKALADAGNVAEFTPTHPLYVECPALESEDCTALVPSDTKPVYRVGDVGVIMHEKRELCVENKEYDKHTFRRFIRLEPEDFLFCGDKISLPVYNPHSGKGFTVVGQKQFMVGDENIHDISEMGAYANTGYPCTHIRGTKYLLVDLLGDMWEATI